MKSSREFISVIDNETKILLDDYQTHPKRKCCKRGHELREDNVYHMSNGHRRCKICTSRLCREHYERKKHAS